MTTEKTWEEREAEREEAEDRMLDALDTAISADPTNVRPRAITGADADIEANYPGGLAAHRRDELDDHDRTPSHKAD
jgi:hypothetical protein